MLNKLNNVKIMLNKMQKWENMGRQNGSRIGQNEVENPRDAWGITTCQIFGWHQCNANK